MTQEQFDALPNSVVIERESDNGIQTLGTMDVQINNNAVFNCKTLELPWKDNENKISCIPKGFYEMHKIKSASKGNCFHVRSIAKKEVTGRVGICVHSGNYFTEILGCILPGKRHLDINKDKQKDVTESKATMKELYDLLPNMIYLQIK